jgi:predicted  nucleic acid-binding Zn-ribbon protein
MQTIPSSPTSTLATGMAAGTLITAVAIKTYDVAKKALFPELKPAQVLQIEEVVENSLGKQALKYFPHFEKKGDQKSKILYPALPNHRTRTPYAPHIEFEVNKWLAEAKAYIKTRTWKRWKFSKSKPYHQSLIRGLMITLLVEAPNWWENTKHGLLEIDHEESKSDHECDIRHQPVNALKKFLFELRGDEYEHAEKIDLVDVLIDKFDQKILPELREKKSHQTIGQQFATIHYGLQYLLHDILLLVTVLSDKTILETQQDVNLMTPEELAKGRVHIGLGDKRGLMRHRVIDEKMMVDNHLAKWIQTAAKGERLIREELFDSEIRGVIKDCHPILSHQLKEPDGFTTQITRLEKIKFNSKHMEIAKKRHEGMGKLLSLLKEIKLLEEMTFYFSLIVNAYGEVTVIYQMQEMIEYMSEKFASTRQVLTDLMEKRELLGDLTALLKTHRLPDELKKTMILPGGENILETLLSNVRRGVRQLHKTFKSVKNIEQARKRNSDEKLSELKHRILDCALSLEEIQQERLGKSPRDKVAIKERGEMSKKIAYCLGLDYTQSELFVKHREQVHDILREYRRYMNDDSLSSLYDPVVLKSILAAIFKSTPVNIYTGGINLFPSMEQLIALQQAQQNWQRHMLPKSSLKLKSSYQSFLAWFETDMTKQNFPNWTIKKLNAVDELLRETLPQLFDSMKYLSDSRDMLSYDYRLKEVADTIIKKLVNRLVCRYETPLHLHWNRMVRSENGGWRHAVPKPSYSLTNKIRGILSYLPLETQRYSYEADGPYSSTRWVYYGDTYHLDLDRKKAKILYNILSQPKHQFWVSLKKVLGEDKNIMQNLSDLKKISQDYCTQPFVQKHNFAMQSKLNALTHERDLYKKENQEFRQKFEKLNNHYNQNLENLKQYKLKVYQAAENTREMKQLIQTNQQKAIKQLKQLTQKQRDKDFAHDNQIKELTQKNQTQIKELTQKNKSLNILITELQSQHQLLENNVRELKNSLQEQDKKIQQLIRLFDETNECSLKSFSDLETEATNILGEFCNTKNSNVSWKLPSSQKIGFDYQRKLHRVKNRVHENLGRDKNEQEKIQNFLNKFKQFAQYVEEKSKSMRQSIIQSVKKREILDKELKESRLSIENKFNSVDAVIQSQKTTIKSLEKMNFILLNRIKEQENLI